MAQSTRALYRELLKRVKAFPSVKREGLLREIKADFRANASLTDGAKIQQCLAVAQEGLEQLRQWTSPGVKESEEIVITLDPWSSRPSRKGE